MRHLTTVISDESIDSLHARVITNTICSAMRSFHDGLKFYFIIYYFYNEHSDGHYISLPMFVFVCSPLRLVPSYKRWSKTKCRFFICEIVFHFSLWLKSSIFFSLVLFSFEMHNRSRKKLSRKKLNFDRVLQQCTLCNLIVGGGGVVPVLKKNCYLFPPLPFINTSSQMKIFMYSTYSFLLQLLSLPAHRPFNK